MIKVLGLILVLSFLGGCSMKSPLEGLEHYDGVNEATVALECRTWLMSREAREDTQIANLDPTAQAYALMHRQTMRMIETTFGKDPCAPGSNVWDAYMVYAKEQGETNRVAWERSTGLLGTAIKITGGVLVANELADMVSDINKNSGSTYDIGGDFTGRDKTQMRNDGEGVMNFTGSTNPTTDTTTVNTTVTDDSFNQD
jgi:hypothetical protein